MLYHDKHNCSRLKRSIQGEQLNPAKIDLPPLPECLPGAREGRFALANDSTRGIEVESGAPSFGYAYRMIRQREVARLIEEILEIRSRWSMR